MDGTRQTITRDANGRFLPGCSGNPAGKRPGTRNRATLLRAVMEEGEGHAMARLVVDRAVGGDAVAARFCLDRIEPKPRGRPISLDLPEGVSSAEAVTTAFDSALRQLADGEITPTEAVEISRFLESRIRALRACGRGEAEADDAAVADARPSSPLGERIEVRGSRGASSSPVITEQAAAPPLPNLSPRGEVSDRPATADLPPNHLHPACISRASARPHGVRQALLGTASHRWFEPDLARAA
jgi:hypothetical protein